MSLFVMNHSVTIVAKLSGRKVWGDNWCRLSTDWLSLPLTYSYMDETSGHKSIVIVRRISKTQSQSKVLIVSIIVSSVVSVTIIIVRIKKFPFSFRYDYDAYDLVWTVWT